MVEQSRYQPPKADLVESDGLSSGKSAAEKILFSVGLLGAFVTAVAATFLVPAFKDIYSELGGTLPLLTSLISSFYGLAWLLPLAPIAAWVAWPNVRRRGRVGAWMAMAIPLIGFPTLVFALYLPMFGLAATI